MKKHIGFPIVDSVLQGLSPKGSLYALGDSLFVKHDAGFCALTNPDQLDFQAFKNLITQDEWPIYFHVYNATESLINSLLKEEQSFTVRIRERAVLRPSSEAPEHHLPVGYTVAVTDYSNLERVLRLPLDLDSRFYSSASEFLEQGNAVVVFDSNEEPVSICYSAATIDGLAEIDVFTLEQHKRKGLALVAASHFRSMCKSQGVTPTWDTFVDNQASFNLATLLGYKEVYRYTFTSIFRKNERKST